MKALLLGLAVSVLMASPAVAQTAPEPLPTPSVSPLPAPPPPPVQVNVTVGEQDPLSACKPWQIKCQFLEVFDEKSHKWYQRTQDAIRSILVSATHLLVTPNPFDSERVRTLWLALGIPICIALIVVLMGWAASKGTLGNPHHMSPSELIGRAGIALGAGVGSIFAIPWYLDKCNETARKMAFAPLVANQDLSSDPSVIAALILIVGILVGLVVVLLMILRWVVLTLWCISAPIGAVPYTLATTEDVAFTYAKGLGVMGISPIVEMVLVSALVWIISTGHGILSGVGAWIDAALLVALLGILLGWELYVFKTVLGIGNRIYVQTKQALRGARKRGKRWATEPLGEHL